MKFDRADALAALLITTFMTAPASATQFEVGGSAALDFNAGADTLAVLTFNDGSNQNIKAGNGVA
jgi:hypothetical protein